MHQENYVTEPVSKVNIRFQDCDPFGHLNNARYLDYFLNAREDHLAGCYDLDIYERQKTKRTNWVIFKTQIAYLFPVVFREDVLIRTRLLGYDQNRIMMEGLMTDSNEQFIKSIVWIHFSHFHLDRKSATPHPADIMALWDNVCLKDTEIENMDFDRRVRQIRSVFREQRL